MGPVPKKNCRVKNYKEVLTLLGGGFILGTHALLRIYNSCICVCRSLLPPPPPVGQPFRQILFGFRFKKKPCLPGANRIYGQGLNKDCSLFVLNMLAGSESLGMSLLLLSIHICVC